jgi:hypothetical protein
MKRTMTVRVDLASHDELVRLARSYSAIDGCHRSIVDVVRMGISLLAKNERRRLEHTDAVQEPEAARMDVRERA